jgi:hypothetical protein
MVYPHIHTLSLLNSLISPSPFFNFAVSPMMNNLINIPVQSLAFSCDMDMTQGIDQELFEYWFSDDSPVEGFLEQKSPSAPLVIATERFNISPEPDPVLLEASNFIFSEPTSCPVLTSPVIEMVSQLKASPASPVNLEASKSCELSSCGVSFDLLKPNGESETTIYRREAIKRWKAKRERRSFRKKIVCKARKDYAETRVRKGGRFVKSTGPGWVSITDV